MTKALVAATWQTQLVERAREVISPKERRSSKAVPLVCTASMYLYINHFKVLMFIFPYILSNLETLGNKIFLVFSILTENL